jgi:L-threonylcarbamoyladenylate synthase
MASDFSIRHAAHIISKGGIIAYPTDTIYGLGCDPYNVDAVERLNIVKQRPANKYFILLAGHIDQVRPLLKASDQELKKISSCDQPTSWVVDAAPCTPDWLTDDENTLTVRITDNELIKKLCAALGHAVISTSANLSGKKHAETTFRLHKYFHHSVDKILAADQPLHNRASRIIRLCDNHIFRR